MNAASITKRLAFVGIAFAAGLAAGAGFVLTSLAPSQPKLKPGATLASFSDDGIMSLTYTTSRGTMMAQRSKPGAFAIQTTFTDGRPVQHCGATANLGGALKGFTDLTVKRPISLEERGREFPVQLGVLDIRDQVLGEPSGPVLVFTNRNQTSVAIILEGQAAEVALPVAAFVRLEGGCATLADDHTTQRRWSP